MPNKLTKEFLAFLKEYNVVTLAIGFVIGTTSTSFVNALVKDIFMPLVQPLMAGGEWQTAVFSLGPIHIAYGAFLAELINFSIIMFIIFLVVKKLLQMNVEVKK